MLLLRNKDQHYNNPLESLATCLCRQRSGRKWTASSSLHDTRTVNLALVQSECYTGKQTVITRALTVLIGIKLLISRFHEIFTSYSQFPEGEMSIFALADAHVPCLGVA